MNAKTLLVKNLKKTPDLGEKCIVVLSEAKTKSDKWTTVFPDVLADRLKKVLARRTDALKAGEALTVTGVEKNEPDLHIAVLL